MVKVFPGNPINLEDIVEISEGQLAIIKANKKKIDALCKDLHVSHTYYTNEGGTNMSKIGVNISNEDTIEETIKDIKAKHGKLLEFVDSIEISMEETKGQLLLTESEKGVVIEGNIHPLKAAFILFMAYQTGKEKYDSKK